jgi:hypothetical protein
MEATKTIYQDDLVTAQEVKTLGRRNAKPTAPEKLWKNTSNITERHQLRTKQEDEDTRERKRRWRYRGDSRPM